MKIENGNNIRIINKILSKNVDAFKVNFDSSYILLICI